MIKNSKIYVTMLSLVILLSVLIAGLSVSAVPHVGAVTLEANNFDATKLEDDLADIDLSKYPQNPDGTPQVFEFVEYCYTDNIFKQTNYALYLYVYNPAQTEFSAHGGVNTVSMAVAYGNDGLPVDYENMSLKYLSRSTESGRVGLFYKFKINRPNKAVYGCYCLR